MENENIIERLNRYEYDTYWIYKGFKNFNEAVQFSESKQGKLVEIGFLDGNDNPVLDSSGQLIKNKDYFYADAGPGYKIIHSGHKNFQELVDKWVKRTSEISDKSIEEKVMSDSDALISEDGVFVLYNDEIESVTSRERCRYLKHTKVYELGVQVTKAD